MKKLMVIEMCKISFKSQVIQSASKIKLFVLNFERDY